MVYHVTSADSIGTGVRVSLADFDDAYVAGGVQVISTDMQGIVGVQNSHRATIAGDVNGFFTGVQLGDDSQTDNSNHLHVLAGASVTSQANYGTDVRGADSTINNYGTIGGAFGILLIGDRALLTNHGHIYGELGSAVDFRTSANSVGAGAEIINFGTISCPSFAIIGDIDFRDIIRNFGSISGDILQSGGDDLLINAGRIAGDVNAGFGADIVDNRNGHITGDVLLDTDADQFDNRGGTVSGTVFGESGDDRFIGNASWADVFDGGLDKDTLDFRTQGAVSLALDGSFDPGGSAQGDDYANFEDIFGSRGGNDVLRGDGGGNALFGLGGVDSLDGSAGQDFLRGGAGADVLNGGLGNDSFVFMALYEIGDTISDFSSVGVGNNDVFRISASGFGGGLVAGALAASQFQTRADNLSQDGNDRFIFRTTDQTLWFDADGNGLTSAAVMVADLQASATMTNLDILVV